MFAYRMALPVIRSSCYYARCLYGCVLRGGPEADGEKRQGEKHEHRCEANSQPAFTAHHRTTDRPGPLPRPVPCSYQLTPRSARSYPAAIIYPRQGPVKFWIAGDIWGCRGAPRPARVLGMRDNGEAARPPEAMLLLVPSSGWDWHRRAGVG